MPKLIQLMRIKAISGSAADQQSQLFSAVCGIQLKTCLRSE